MKKYILLVAMMAVSITMLATSKHVWKVKVGEKVTAEEAAALDRLYAAMPLADKEMQTGDYYLQCIRIANAQRRATSWGASIPDDVFNHFVVPVRINNENLDNFRVEYYAELADRVKGLSLHDAALEVNHWCHEKVTYEPSDSRTSAPSSTIRTAKGRCGEESTLTVAAMRTAGIPARQVYTPRWAHTDDNHAWVEVWVDGKWYFLGACEPEPELNRAWFNAPVARGMLMHTRVLGEYTGPEPVISKQNGITEINVVENYVPTRINTVTVTDENGTSVKGAKVEFKIYNYAEFYTVAKFTSDDKGQVSLKTGKGDMLAWASLGDRFGFAKVHDENTTVVLNHKVGDRISEDITVIPPVEGSIPSNVTDAQIAENNRRLVHEDSIRNAYTATFPTKESTKGLDERVAGILIKSRGNHTAIQAVLDNAPGDRKEDLIGMLESVTDKDLRDTPANVLLDAIFNSKAQPGNKNYVKYVLNPRISNELLSPFHSALKKKNLKTPLDVAQWVKKNVAIDDKANPMRVPIVPTAVHKSHKADSHSRDIYFVALCRANGMAARIDPITGKTQYFGNGDWVDVDFVKAETVEREKGMLQATYEPSKVCPNPQYYRHFTLAEIRGGSPALLEFDENTDYFENTLGKGVTLDAGYYMLTSGTRLANGGVLAHIELLPVEADQTAKTTLVMRQSSNEISVIGNMDAEKLYQPRNGVATSILSTTGRGYFIVAVLGTNDEPSNHAVHEFVAAAPTLNEWGRPVLVLSEKDKPELAALNNIHTGSDIDGSVAAMLRTGTNSTRTDLPVIAICDSFGRIVYITEGYNTSLAENLKAVISKL